MKKSYVVIGIAIVLITFTIWYIKKETITCSNPKVIYTVTMLVNKNMSHDISNTYSIYNNIKNVVGDHASIDAIRTVQAGHPLHGYTCTAFAHGLKLDGSLFDEKVDHVSFEYTVQPNEGPDSGFVVGLKP